MALLWVLVLTGVVLTAQWSNGPYPQHIPPFDVRRDLTTGQAVSRGRLHLVGETLVSNDRSSKFKISYQSYRERLQCAPTEPDLDRQGSLSLMKLLPPSAEIIELICAWLESSCDSLRPVQHDPIPWSKCRTVIEQYRRGDYRKDDLDFVRNEHNVNHFSWPKLLHRVINGTLYLDWPWGIV